VPVAVNLVLVRAIQPIGAGRTAHNLQSIVDRRLSNLTHPVHEGFDLGITQSHETVALFSLSSRQSDTPRDSGPESRGVVLYVWRAWLRANQSSHGRRINDIREAAGHARTHAEWILKETPR